MLNVWILETWYEDGDHEINCICKTEEKAEKEKMDICTAGKNEQKDKETENF